MLSAGFDILGGLAGLWGGIEAGRAAESRARLIELEAEVDAQRYQEKAEVFLATQKLAYLKGGIELAGSPLDVLDETARVSAENLSAIRSRGRFEHAERLAQAEDFRAKGRSALVGGFKDAAKTLITTSIYQGETTGLGLQNRKNVAVVD